MAVFSDRLRFLRNELNISQQDLAHQLGLVSKSSINMYERGEREPGIEVLCALADYFSVSVDFLLGRTDTATCSDQTHRDTHESSESENDFRKAVGQRLYEARKIKGYSRARVGEMVGLHESTVKRYEDGEIKSLDVERLMALSEVVGLTIQELL